MVHSPLLVGRRLLVLIILCCWHGVACRAASAQPAQKHTWGFVAARIDSRFSHSIYTGYGYESVFLIGGLVANPRNGYSEQALGAGLRLPKYRRLSQLAVLTFSNASDSRYIQLYYLPSSTLRHVSMGAALEVDFPLERPGVKQFAITGLSVATRMGGPFAAGLVYELSAVEHAPVRHGAGMGLRLALPDAELAIDALRGLAHQRDHARMMFRAFY
jgi:hypothetical protein